MIFRKSRSAGQGRLQTLALSDSHEFLYEHYYGFARSPFSITPDPEFLYRTPSHERALDQLLRGIHRREGFMVLTGDIGTGKTMLCRALVERLGRRTFSALVLNPFVSEEELLRIILQDFGVLSRQELRRGPLGAASRQQLVETLSEFLLSLEHLDATAVVIVDEAQNLPARALEQLRLLANLETDRYKLLQIVLAGQLELEALLATPELRQLDQRISRRCRLEPLSREAVRGYIDHRLGVARSTWAVGFTPEAANLVWQASGGVPRKVNLLCDRSLEIACGHVEGPIRGAIVREAAAGLARGRLAHLADAADALGRGGTLGGRVGHVRRGRQRLQRRLLVAASGDDARPLPSGGRRGVQRGTGRLRRHAARDFSGRAGARQIPDRDFRAGVALARAI